MGNYMALLMPARMLSRLHTAKKDKILRVVRADGKVLVYRSPIQVGILLSEFHGHAIGTSRRAKRHLPPDYELKTGRAYYLLPLKRNGSSLLSPTKAKVGEEDSRVKRIKIVITKQQLQDILSAESVTLEDMLSKIKERGPKNSTRRWRPRLETIQEENGHHLPMES